MGFWEDLTGALSRLGTNAQEKGYDPGSTVFYPGARTRQEKPEIAEAIKDVGDTGSGGIKAGSFGDWYEQAKNMLAPAYADTSEQPSFVGPVEAEKQAQETVQSASKRSLEESKKRRQEAEQRDWSDYWTFPTDQGLVGAGDLTGIVEQNISSMIDSNENLVPSDWEKLRQYMLESSRQNLKDNVENPFDSVRTERNNTINQTIDDAMAEWENEHPTDTAYRNPDATRNAAKRNRAERQANQDYFDDNGNLVQSLVDRDLGTYEGFAPALLAASGLTRETMGDDYDELLMNVNNTRLPVGEYNNMLDRYVFQYGEEEGSRKAKEELAKKQQESAQKTLDAILQSSAIQGNLNDKYDLDTKGEYSFEDQLRLDGIDARIADLDDPTKVVEGDDGNALSYDQRQAEKESLLKQREELVSQMQNLGTFESRKEGYDKELAANTASIAELLDQAYSSDLRTFDLAKNALGLSDIDAVKRGIDENVGIGEGQPGSDLEENEAPEQIETFVAFINTPEGQEFLDRHPEYKQYADQLEYMYTRMRLDAKEDVWKDLYGYSGYNGVGGWKDYLLAEGLDPEDAAAWAAYWDIISRQRAIRRSDFAPGGDLSRWGSGLAAHWLGQYLGTEEARQAFGDLLNWGNVLKQYADKGINLDEGDLAQMLDLSRLTKYGMSAGMTPSQLLKVLNLGLQEAGDAYRIGVAGARDDIGGIYEELGEGERANPREYDYWGMFDGANSTQEPWNPWSDYLYDWDALDSGIDLYRKSLERSGSDAKVGTSSR